MSLYDIILYTASIVIGIFIFYAEYKGWIKR